MSRQKQRETDIDCSNNKSCGKGCKNGAAASWGFTARCTPTLRSRRWSRQRSGINTGSLASSSHPSRGLLRNEEFEAFEVHLLALSITFCQPTNTRKHHAAQHRPCNTDSLPARTSGALPARCATAGPRPTASPLALPVSSSLTGALRFTPMSCIALALQAVEEPGRLCAAMQRALSSQAL